MKTIRNILNHKLHKVIINVKGLRNTKTYAPHLILSMLLVILSLSLGFSSLINSVIIGSSGRIAMLIPATYESEVRGVFIHDLNFAISGPDWDVITETCRQYGINRIYAHVVSLMGSRYPSAYVRQSTEGGSRDELRLALDAAHARGLELHACMLTVYVPGSYLGDYYRAWDDQSNIVAWTCPTKAHDLIMNLIEELITNYPDIDGFMHDYIRYDTAHVCYCPECKAKFQEWLGEGLITDWTPFYPNGTRWLKYVEWRLIPITELVRDSAAILRAHKPDIEISEAAWTYFSDCPTYWRKWIGQDTGDWIRNGWVDSVAPMSYVRGESIGGTNPLGQIEGQITTNFKYMVAGPEGKIPYYAFLRMYYTDAPQNPEEFKAQIEKVRQLGADGWIIWHYGGPGDNSPAPDIRDYLSIVDMPDVFTLGNIKVSTGETQATITWITDLPATTKVEYNTSSMFPAFWRQWSDMYYWDIDHISGIIVENSTLVTSHSVTLTDLLPGTKYYFRVQSQDPSGIASSTVLTFTTT